MKHCPGGGLIIYFTSSLPALVLFTLGLVVSFARHLQSPILCRQEESRLELTHCELYGIHTTSLDVTGLTVRKDYRYYPWISLSLMSQSLLVLLTAFLWKYFCGGRIFPTVNGGIPRNPNEHDNYVSNLVDFITTEKACIAYFWKHIGCEILSYFNFGGQILITHWFLRGQFLALGLESYQPTVYKDEKYTELPVDYSEYPMDFLTPFPRMVRCGKKELYKGGMSEFYDMCMLTLNPLHEAVYLFLWYFFMGTVVLSMLLFVFRMCLLLSYKLRVIAIRFLCPSLSSDMVNVLTSRCDTEDWMIVYFACGSLDEITRLKFLKRLAQQLKVDQNHKELSSSELKQDECVTIGL